MGEFTIRTTELLWNCIANLFHLDFYSIVILHLRVMVNHYCAVVQGNAATQWAQSENTWVKNKDNVYWRFLFWLFNHTIQHK